MAAVFNVDVCGTSGKSAYMRRLYTGEFYSQPVPLACATVTYRTTRGEFTINYNERNIFNDDDTADGRILIIDPDNTDCCYPLKEFSEKLKSSSIPYIAVIGFSDTVHEDDYDNFPFELLVMLNIECEMSSKTNENIEKPVLYILRKMTGYADLDFL